MHIVITSTEYLTQEGAASVHLLGLLDGLCKISDAHLFAAKKEGQNNEENITYISRPDINKFCNSIYYEINLFYRLVLYCRQNNVDVIYHRQSGLNLAPLLISKLFNLVYFIEVNGLFDNEIHLIADRSPLTTVTTRIIRIFAKLTYKLCTKVITVSNGIKIGMENNYNIPSEKVIFVENGVDHHLFRPLDKENSDLDIDLSYRYICFVGSFAHRHGLEQLIKSSPLIIKEIPNVKFLLVGTGILEQKIREMVSEQDLNDYFLFVGKVPHKEIFKYINISDVCFIFKHRSIPGSPLKLYEYMACGKPVIATNSDDFKILKTINAGLLVDPDDSFEVASSIIKVLKNETLMHKMGQNAHEYIINNRTWEITAKEIYSLADKEIKNNKK